MLPCWPLPCPLAVRKKKLRLLTLLLLRPLKLLLLKLLLRPLKLLLLRPLTLLPRPLTLLPRLLTLLPRLLMLLPLRPKKRSSNSCFVNGGFGHHATKTLRKQGFCFGDLVTVHQNAGIFPCFCACLP